MTEVLDLIGKLRRAQIELTEKAGQLYFSGPDDKLTAQLKGEILRHRDDLLSLIRVSDTAGQDNTPHPAAPPRASLIQQRLWFVAKTARNHSAFNIPVALRLAGRFDIAAFRRAFETVVNRHEVLRARFRDVDGNLTVELQDVSKTEIDDVDLSACPESERENRVADLARKWCGRPFEIDSDSLVRLCLVRLGDQDHAVILVFSHLVADAHTLQLFARELEEVYAGRLTAAASPPKWQYWDYVAWQEQQSEHIDARLQHQLSALSGRLPVLRLVTDHPRPRLSSLDGGTHPFAIDTSLLNHLRAAARRQNCSLFVFMLAVFILLLRRYSGQDDIIVGCPTAGRPTSNLRAVLGPCANIAVLRASIDLTAPFAALLAQLRRTTTDTLENEVPFEFLVQALRPERVANQAPLFRVMFNLEGGADAFSGLRLADVTTHVLPVDTGAANFDLHLSLFEQSDTVTGALLYSTDLFEEETIHKMAEDYLDLLNKALKPDVSTVQSILEPNLSLKTRVLLASNIYADPFAVLLHKWIDQLHLPVNLEVSVQDQLTRLLVDETSQIVGDKTDVTLIVLEPEAWSAWLAHREREHASSESRTSEFARLVDRRRRQNGDVLVVLLPPRTATPPSPEREHLLDEFTRQIRAVAPAGCLDLRHSKRLQNAVAAATAPNHALPEAAYSDDLNLAISIELARAVTRRFLPIIKVIVTDCDYTLWGGNCADQPPETLRISDGHCALQRFLVRQQAQGRLLCLCSRNDDHHVLKTFDALRDMPLSLDHITAHRLNHAPKSENLRDIADQLNVGLDAILFIDDDPLECAEVAQACPDVWTLQVPRDPDALALWIERLWILDEQATTAESQARTRLYRDQAKRAEATKIHENIGALLEDLQLTVIVREHTGDWQRIAELTQRTNQFNPLKNPMRPSDLADKMRDGRFKGWEATATDRFGSYGVIGAMVAKIEDDRAEVEQFVLSCRAFNRTIEFRMARHLLDWAESEGLRGVVFKVKPTPANGPARAFLRALGLPATVDASGSWLLPSGKGRQRVADAEAAVCERPLISAKMEPSDAPSKPARARPAPRRALLELVDALENTTSLRQFLDLRSTHQWHLNLGSQDLTEQNLTRIAADILNIDRVDAKTNVLAAGADSLMQLQLATACRNAGWDLRIEDFAQHQTVGELFTLLTSRAKLAEPTDMEDPFSLLSEPDRSALRRDRRLADAYPLSGMQAGMVFHAAQDRDAAVYLVIDSFRLRGPFHEAFIRQAIDRVVDRHAMLRTSFDLETYTEPLQKVAKAVQPIIDVVDLRAVESPQRQAAFDAWLEQERHCTFSQAHTLVRYTVHRFEDDLFQITVTHHHAILDGWSLNTLVRELMDIYDGLCGGGTPPQLPPPTPGFAAFIRAERAAAASPAQKDFWADRLHDLSASTPNRRPPGQHPRPRVRAVSIPVTLGADLAAVANRFALPLKSLLLAVHLAVIGVWTCQRHIVTGLLFNGRLEGGQTDQVLGLFVNSLPIRIDLKSETWVALAQRAAALEREVEPFRRVPLLDLQRMSGIAPLFQFLFTFTHFHMLDKVREHRNLEVVDTFNYVRDTIPVHAFFDVNPYAEEEIRFLLNVDEARLSAAEVDGLADLYAAALRNLGRAPERSWVAGLYPDGNTATLPSSSVVPDGSLPALTVDRAFAAQARRHPDRIALIEGRRRVTYGALDQQSRRLAGALNARGLARDVVIGVACQSGIETAIAFLAIARSGGAWLAIDPSWPRDRQEWVLQNAGAIAVINDQDGPTTLAGLPKVDVTASGSPSTNESANDPERLAYVIYTSGSTGAPKGVMVPHSALAFLFASARQVFISGEDTVWTLVHSFGFDLSMWEFWAALVSGGSLLLIPQEGRRDPATFQGVLNRERPGVVNLTPSAVERLLPDTLSKKLLSSANGLKAVVLGGELLPSALASELLDLNIPLWDFYGPTEATVWSAMTAVPDAANAGTLRSPLPGVTMAVFDAFARPARGGGIGRLQIAGPGLAWGYLGRPTLTALAFQPNPLAQEPGERLYDTGDYVEHCAAGGCKFLGRQDQQIKLRGYRIEIGEIEAAVRDHSDVTKAVVIAVHGSRDEATALHCFYVGDTVIDERLLRSFLRSRLPDYMIPSRFTQLADLPITRNNKLDRRALEKQAQDAPDSDRPKPPVAPLTPFEEVVSGVWQSVLGSRGLDATADFFALGGDSIGATQVAVRLRQLLGHDVPVRRLFGISDLRSYAAAIRQETETDDRRWDRLATMRAEDGRAPLSSGQRRLWLADQLAPHKGAYNIPVILKWTGPLDINRMRESLWRCLTRHRVVVSRIGVERGKPFQEMLAAETLTITHLDARPADNSYSEKKANELLLQFAHEPFDLSAGPLARACIITLGEDRHFIVTVIHHSVCDAWSVVILRNEIAYLYQAIATDPQADLPSLPIQYPDYARWEAKWGRLVWERSLPWWLKTLEGGLPPLQLRRWGRSEMAGDGTLTFDLPVDTVDRLKALAQSHQCTLFMVLLAAFKAALARSSGQTDLWIAGATSCRDHPVLEGLVGFLVNTLVYRTSLAGCRHVADLLQRVRTTALEVFEHRHVPFEELVFRLNPRRNSLQPLMHAVFELHNAPNQPIALENVGCDVVEIPAVGAKYELALLAQEVPSGLSFVLEYDPGVYAQPQMKAVCTQFRQVVAHMLQAPETPLDLTLHEPEVESPAPQAPSARNRWRDRFQHAAKSKPAGQPAPAIKRRGVVSDVHRLPLIFEPTLRNVQLASWIRRHRHEVDRDLAHHGALLFRGLAIDSPEMMQEVAASLIASLVFENGEHTPVHDAPGVQVPVNYPADHKLFWHNENTFNNRWPTRILFACGKPADTGGETPLVDSRRIFEALPDEITAAFATRQIRYVRTYNANLGLPWQTVFLTDDPRHAEAKCREQDIAYEWLPDGSLQTTAVRPAIYRHPQTGEWCWCNQLQHWHPACLDAQARKVFADIEGGGFPRTCWYGDGKPIPDDVVRTILETYTTHEVMFRWEKGDLLVLDNLMIAHGRNPYRGERHLYVAMGDCITV